MFFTGGNPGPEQLRPGPGANKVAFRSWELKRQGGRVAPLPVNLYFNISACPSGGYPALASSFLIASTLVFVSSNTIVALWFTALESTDFTPSILCAVILTVVAVSPQTHPGILNFTVFSAASALPAAPNPTARIAASASTNIILVLIKSPPWFFVNNIASIPMKSSKFLPNPISLPKVRANQKKLDFLF